MTNRSEDFPSCDVAVWTGPTVYTFDPRTPIGDEWLSDECDWPDWAGARVAEPRFAWDIIAGAVNDGLLRVAVDGRLIKSIEHA